MCQPPISPASGLRSALVNARRAVSPSDATIVPNSSLVRSPVTSVKVGLAQTLVMPGQVAENLARVAAMVEEAHRESCDIVVLPECVDVGWADLRASELATPIPGSTSEFFCALAKRFEIMIASGLTERAGDSVFNAAVLIDRKGRILTTHRKINELDFARLVYGVGSQLRVVESEFGKIALNICADNFPESLALADAQAAMGAVLMLSPSSWAVPPNHDEEATPYALWDEPYGLIGRRHGIPVVGVSNVGPVTTGKWAGRACIGRSVATDASGQVVVRGSYGVEASELRTVVLALASRAAVGANSIPLLEGGCRPTRT